MKVAPYYKNYNQNVGKIKSIADNLVHINVNAGRNKNPEMKIPITGCYQFTPKVDDRVLLSVNEEDGSFVLIKLTKERSK